ncbi:MAG: hypothetical protein PUE01_09640 [Clostridiaceae bacterium]|nr:hypothetical protein [Clostridiaceae bacterium]
MKKKVISLIVIVAGLFIIYNIISFPKTIDKSYKSYYINETEDKITGTCDYSIL